MIFLRSRRITFYDIFVSILHFCKYPTFLSVTYIFVSMVCRNVTPYCFDFSILR